MTMMPTERITGYTYGTTAVARLPFTLDDLEKLKAAVGLTAEDERYLRMAADVLANQAEDMVTVPSIWP